MFYLSHYGLKWKEENLLNNYVIEFVAHFPLSLSFLVKISKQSIGAFHPLYLISYFKLNLKRGTNLIGIIHFNTDDYISLPMTLDNMAS